MLLYCGHAIWCIHIRVLKTRKYDDFFIFPQKISDALSLKLGREALKFDRNSISDRDVRRKLQMISMIGSSILAPEKLERFNKLSNDMAKIYSTAKVPAYKDKSKMLSLEPGLTEAMANSRLVSFIVDIPDIKIMREII